MNPSLTAPTPAATVDTQDLVELLHARGQRVTPQRVIVLRELRRRAHHATADEIRRSVHADLPGTSAPTVYAALELLVELGLARRVDVGSGAVLYDGRTEPHQHTVCRRCGQVADLDAEVDATAVLTACVRVGFAVGAVEVVASGLCPDCARAQLP
jgi:Fe2+ or Zn2+ uptake regulation protein